MPQYSGGERLFTFQGLTKNNNTLTSHIRATSHAEALRHLSGWGIHSATHLTTRYLEGVERTSVALFETSEDPFLGSRWTVAIDGINRATRFSLGGNVLELRFVNKPGGLTRPAPTIRVRASRTGSGQVWIGHPSVIAPADGANAALLLDLGWTWRHQSVSDGFTIDLAPGWNLPHALHLAIRSLQICGAITDDSYIHVSGQCVVTPTVIGWWTEFIEHHGQKLYRIPAEWPPPPRHPSQQPKQGVADSSTPVEKKESTARARGRHVADR
jgi:hypothetical protein